MGRNETKVYWGTFRHPFFRNRPLCLAATRQGLCRITWPDESLNTLRIWVDKKIPNAVLIKKSDQLYEYVRQLQEYFEGSRKVFTLPLDLRGTAFQTSVWQALNNIPYGQTRSYSYIAETVDSSEAVRAVGAANGANPVPIVVPCHRVIGKNAALTGFRGGLHVKKELLELEGFYDYTPNEHVMPNVKRL